MKKIFLIILIAGLAYLYGLNLQQYYTKQNNAPKKHPSDIHHVVLCWLKEVSPEIKNNILNESGNLKQIPTLKKLSFGNAIPSNRDIVDDSFDIGLLMIFESKEDMDTYIHHPIHKNFVKNTLKPYLEKVIVYDF